MPMETCSGSIYDESHEEIVYDGSGACPLCEEIKLRKAAEEERDRLQEQLDDAQ